MFICGIHGSRSTNCISVSPQLNFTTRMTARTSARPVAAVAIDFINPVLSFGVKRMRTPPRSGRKIIDVNRGKGILTSYQFYQDYYRKPKERYQDIILNETGMYPAEYRGTEPHDIPQDTYRSRSELYPD